jgi:hypothetical protein
MEDFMKPFAILVLIALLAFSCSTPPPAIPESPVEESVVPSPSSALAPLKVFAKAIAGLASYYTVDREGSRSEIRHYFLMFAGKTLPETFTLVVCSSNGMAYYFASSDGFKDDGYIPMFTDFGDFYEFPDPVADIGPGDLELGYYLGGKPKAGTPTTWIYVESGDFRAFIDPGKADEIAETFGLTPLPRKAGLELEP